MMTELSLNILDIAQNSVRADAACVEITVEADTRKDKLVITIADDGCGMTAEQIAHVEDPFFTTRTTRKVGLGVPFFKYAAESTGGAFSIRSEVGGGTSVRAEFGLSHIDRMPLGDITGTIHTLVVFHPETDFKYTYIYNDASFVLDTREMKEILGNVPLDTPEVSEYIREYLSENKKEADGGVVY